MVFCVSVQLAMVGWSDEAFHHLRLLMHHHCDHGRGALHPPGYRLWKSLKGECIELGGWELTSGGGHGGILEGLDCRAKEPGWCTEVNSQPVRGFKQTS